MSPLGRLVKAAMDDRGMSTRDVENAGGPPASTTGRIINPRVKWKRPPADATLASLIRVLKLPPVRVQQALAETMAWDLGQDTHANEEIRFATAAMAGLSSEQQQTIAKVVGLLAERFRADAPRFEDVRAGLLLLNTAEQPDEESRSLRRAARSKTRKTTRELMDEQDDPS